MPFNEWKLRNSSSTTAAGGSPPTAGSSSEQAAPYRGEMLLRLGEVVVHERRDEIAGVIGHPGLMPRDEGTDASCARARASNSATDKASVAGRNGFVMYAEAPAWSAASRLVSSPRVVRTRTGTSL